MSMEQAERAQLKVRAGLPTAAGCAEMPVLVFLHATGYISGCVDESAWDVYVVGVYRLWVALVRKGCVNIILSPLLW